MNHKGRVAELNRAWRQTRNFLETAARKFDKEAKCSSSPEVKVLLRRYARRVEADRERLERKREMVWEKPLGASGRVQLAHQYERKRPVREDHLDTLFQIRLALLLRQYLHKKDGVSRQTIARLIVFTYLVADLAEDRDGHITINNSERRLNIFNVEQTLRRAGVQ